MLNNVGSSSIRRRDYEPAGSRGRPTGNPGVIDPVVLYDADCRLCRWLLAKLLAWDRDDRLEAVALQSPRGERLLPELTEEERMASWHLVDRDGRRHSAGAAFAPLLHELPGGRPLAAVAERMPGLAERSYRLVAENRGRLGRMIPAAAGRRAEERIKSRQPR